MDIDAALDRLGEVQRELADRRRQLNRLANAHHKGRVEGFFNQGKSVTEREFIADYAVLDLSAEKFEAACEVRILEDERDYLKDLLTYGT